jgi:hypothetical protein
MDTATRRAFLRTSAGLLVAGAAPLVAKKRSASDWVKLGTSGVKVTRLAFGTGTYSGRVQRELGQEGFNRLVRYAYDHGIRFFETADAYPNMPTMLGIALKGLPRDSYRVMTKFRTADANRNQRETIDRLRRELQMDYVDIMLIHCVRRTSWVEDYCRLRDTLSDAKDRKIIRAHGASCHGLLPLRRFPDTRWLDVALLRVNHNGTKMDNLRGEDGKPGDVAEVTSHISAIHSRGTGVIGMKLIGEGAFKTREDRAASIGYVMKLRTVDSITIGYKNMAEIDEAIENVNHGLNG